MIDLKENESESILCDYQGCCVCFYGRICRGTDVLHIPTDPLIYCNPQFFPLKNSVQVEFPGVNTSRTFHFLFSFFFFNFYEGSLREEEATLAHGLKVHSLSLQGKHGGSSYIIVGLESWGSTSSHAVDTGNKANHEARISCTSSNVSLSDPFPPIGPYLLRVPEHLKIARGQVCKDASLWGDCSHPHYSTWEGSLLLPYFWYGFQILLQLGMTGVGVHVFRQHSLHT